jgi:hypothetical protein
MWGAMRIAMAKVRSQLSCCLLLTLLLSPALFAQTGVQSFHIRPNKPVEELRREALAAEPPRENREFRNPELAEQASNSALTYFRYFNISLKAAVPEAPSSS